jgi:hypothetical protein
LTRSEAPFDEISNCIALYILASIEIEHKYKDSVGSVFTNLCLIEYITGNEWFCSRKTETETHPERTNPQNSNKRKEKTEYPRQLANHAIKLQQIFMVRYSWTTHSFENDMLTPLFPVD